MVVIARQLGAGLACLIGAIAVARPDSYTVRVALIGALAVTVEAAWLILLAYLAARL